MRLYFLFILISSFAFAAQPIPERLQVGEYSVALKCDEQWSAQVFPKKGVVTYSYLSQHAIDQFAMQLWVYRVKLPNEASLATGEELAHKLVHEDGLSFKAATWGAKYRLPKKPLIADCPVGSSVLYGDGRSQMRNGNYHYVRAALVLPRDYRSRLIGYLVVGHQVGGGAVREQQEEYFKALIQGLREERPNQSLEPAPTAVTTRAGARVASAVTVAPH
ncbi:hypothetical protein DB347_25330 [Opitutaceae bacterium EW11]|nr:hypothetical protein DB347_25330 [Opitutaceae bacterium EW11]